MSKYSCGSSEGDEPSDFDMDLDKLCVAISRAETRDEDLVYSLTEIVPALDKMLTAQRNIAEQIHLEEMSEVVDDILSRFEAVYDSATSHGVTSPCVTLLGTVIARLRKRFPDADRDTNLYT